MAAIKCQRWYCHDQSQPSNKSDFPSLQQHLVDRVRLLRSMTLAEWMGNCLTSPLGGYYTRPQQVSGAESSSASRSVLGSDVDSSDFVTSPELSQIFGELVGIWQIAALQQVCLAPSSVKRLDLIELGPGHGTMAADVVRVFDMIMGSGTKTKSTMPRPCLHLVEVSPSMAKRQIDTLCGKSSSVEETALARSIEGVRLKDQGTKIERNADGYPYYSGVTVRGSFTVHWYASSVDLPDPQPGTFSAFVAQEFFDALPVHVFELSDDKTWRERLVDLKDPVPEATHANDSSHTSSDDGPFRLVVGTNATLTSRALPPRAIEAAGLTLAEACERLPTGTILEVCPSAWEEVQRIVRDRLLHVNSVGGTALIVDYGRDGPGGDTLRGYRNHKLQPNVLTSPGSCDLTADVDFAWLRAAAKDAFAAVLEQSQGNTNPAKVSSMISSGTRLSLTFGTVGPITQSQWLHNMGIRVRLSKLLEENRDPDTQKRLKRGYAYLSRQMGQRFKVMALIAGDPATAAGMHALPGFPAKVDDKQPVGK
eukprot:Clim_evm45s108 gene=Clim_evmTU45s108